ncbi:MAG: EF-hand domain-containing protein [Pseudomonadota bacterium]
MAVTRLISLAILAGMSLPMTAQAQDMSPADRQLLLENVTEADRNDDGAISRSEFEVLIDLNAADNLGRAQRVKRSGRYDMVFNRLDANDDGFLTRQEMQSFAEERG